MYVIMTVKERKQLGARIKELRENGGEGNRKKMSQEKLAKKLNICRQTLSDSEKGMLKLTIEDLVKICELFECDIGYLLGKHDEKERDVADVREVTGLSEKAVNKLKLFQSKTGYEKNIAFLNAVIESKNFDDLAWSCMEYLTAYSIWWRSYRVKGAKSSPRNCHSERIDIKNYKKTKSFEVLIDQLASDPKQRACFLELFDNSLGEFQDRETHENIAMW